MPGCCGEGICTFCIFGYEPDDRSSVKGLFLVPVAMENIRFCILCGRLKLVIVIGIEKFKEVKGVLQSSKLVRVEGTFFG